MTASQSPTTPTGSVTVVTISGHRQPAVVDSADFRTWHGLANRLGRASCIWAGPHLTTDRGTLQVIRRPRRVGPQSVLWAAAATRAGVRLARASKRRGETVVINGAEPWGWLAAWLVARLVRCPWLMDIHGDYLALPMASLGRWQRAVLKRAVIGFARRATERRVVAQSMVDALGRRGITSVLVPPRLQSIWERPVPRNQPPLSGDGPVMLTVGRLHPSKGYDLLLAAMAEILETLPNARLRIIGDGPEGAKLTDRAAGLGLSKVVEFLGFGSVDEVRGELARADLFVISSRDEGLPRTLLEAAASEVPVVATAVGGIPAAVAGWPTVTLVPVDASAIAQGVRRVVAAPPSAEQLAAVRDEVLAGYGFDTNLDTLAALFRTLNGSAASK